MNKRKVKDRIVFVVDGETEIWYLQMMKEYENLNHLSIDPKLPKKRKLKDIFSSVINYSNDYDRVFWIIDFDVIVKENREAKLGSKSKIDELASYLKKIKSLKNVAVLVNVPCLEFWYLQHIKECGKYFNNCNEVCKYFNESVLKDYEKSEKYYKNRNNNIYSKLKSLLNNARERSSKLGEFDVSNPEMGKAEIYKLFNYLGIS